VEKARSWVRELQRQADPSIIIALCGNKTDLAGRRQVTQEEAQKYAEEEGLMWMEASAKTGEGVQDIFMAIGMYALWIFPAFCYIIPNLHAAKYRTSVYNSDGPWSLTLFFPL